MTSDEQPNPYTSNPTSFQHACEVVRDSTNRVTEGDLKDLRVGAKRAKEPGAWCIPFVLPLLAILIAAFQFYMCWKASQSSGISFAELLSEDSAGFRGDSYDGGLVRMFDHLVTGFLLLVVGGFMYFILRSGRKRDLQNARFHETMLNAGLIPPDPNQNQSSQTS